MRNPMIFAKGAALVLLLVLCMAGTQARAQNQTPANVEPVAPVGGWTDPATGLMWTKQDNGSAMNYWNDAKNYCTNLKLGGYSNWRLPSFDELQSIYDPSSASTMVYEGKSYPSGIKGGIILTGSMQWSASQDSSGAALLLYFPSGHRQAHLPDYPKAGRALCVRR
jgi:hypothetical protein